MFSKQVQFTQEFQKSLVEILQSIKQPAELTSVSGATPLEDIEKVNKPDTLDLKQS